MSQPFSVQAHRKAVCLPEQLNATFDLPSPSSTMSIRVPSCAGHAVGQPRSSSVRPALWSMILASSMCSALPMWLAQANATSAPRSGTPLCIDARAWNGLSDERG